MGRYYIPLYVFPSFLAPQLRLRPPSIFANEVRLEGSLASLGHRELAVARIISSRGRRDERF
jgi:hypothetical protein